MNHVRKPVVAGAFYPGSRASLSDELSRLFGESTIIAKGSLTSPCGLIAPHAGYPFSGPVAATGYSHLASLGKPQWAIILGANHTGMGAPISIMPSGVWRTPLGDTPIDSDLANRLISGEIEVSPAAFAHEHSIEVQLPFLQFLFRSTIPFVPICVMLPPLSELVQAGKKIAEAIQGKEGVVIASSDFTHYQSHEIATQLDQEAIDRILALDSEGFYHLLVEKRLSICGGGAIIILMTIAKKLNVNTARLLSYSTSGDVTGDRSSVVGYASICFSGSIDD